MNKKILIHVYSPATAQTYDMWIPLSCNVNTVANMIADAISILSNGLYTYNDTPALYNANSCVFLDSNSTIYETGLGNAETLILI